MKDANISTEKFSRLIRLAEIGQIGLDKLSNAKIGIFGMGGLGSWSSLLLAQMNVGYLRIVDRDVVELSNLPRTPIYNKYSVDLPKVEEAARFLTKINEDTIIEPIATNIDEFTIDSLVKDLDIIIDGLDTFSTRYIVNKACYKNNIPFIFAGAVGMSCNLSTITYKENTPCLSCFFGNIQDEQIPTCDITGVHTSILSIAASLQVAETAKILIKNNPVLDSKLAFFDLHNYDLDIINIKPREDCNVCGSEVSSTIEKPKIKIIELCGNESFSLAPIPRKSLVITNIIDNLKLNSDIKILKSGELGVTFEISERQVTIFKGGNLLLRNIKTKEEAMKLFEDRIKQFVLP